MRGFNVHKIITFSKGQRAGAIDYFRLTIDYCISTQRTERGRKTEDRRQKTEDRR